MEFKDFLLKLCEKLISLDFVGIFESLKKIVNTNFLYIFTSLLIISLIIVILLATIKAIFHQLGYSNHSDNINKALAGSLILTALCALSFPFYLVFFNYKILDISLVSRGNNTSGSVIKLLSDNTEEQIIKDGIARFKIKKTNKKYSVLIKHNGSDTFSTSSDIINNGNDTQYERINVDNLPFNANFIKPDEIVDVNTVSRLPIELVFLDSNNKPQEVNYKNIDIYIDNRKINGINKNIVSNSLIAKDDTEINNCKLEKYILSINYNHHAYTKPYRLYKKMYTSKKYSKKYKYNHKLVNFYENSVEFKSHTKNEYSEIRFPVKLDVKKDFTVIYQGAILNEKASIELEIGKLILVVVGEGGLDTISLKVNNLSSSQIKYKPVPIRNLDKKIEVNSPFELKVSYHCESNLFEIQVVYEDKSVTKIPVKLPMLPDISALSDLGIAGTMFTTNNNVTNSAMVTSVTVSNSLL